MKTRARRPSRNVAQTHSQGFVPQESWRRVFELEINIFDQQVDGDERFAPSRSRKTAASSPIYRTRSRARFRRLIANAFYEVELALHLSG